MMVLMVQAYAVFTNSVGCQSRPSTAAKLDRLLVCQEPLYPSHLGLKSLLGLYGDDGKENGNYHNGLIRV